MDHSNNSEPRKQKKKLLRLYLRDNTTESKNKHKIICRKTKAACKLANTNFYERQIGRKNESEKLFKIFKDLSGDKNNEQQCTVDCHDMNYFFATFGEKQFRRNEKYSNTKANNGFARRKCG